MTRGIFLLLGSNQGDKRQQLAKAKAALEKQFGSIIAESSIYVTKAWGKTDQPDFENQVIEMAVNIDPIELLQGILEIEKNLGRVHFEKWGPRTIDIDILYFQNKIIDEEHLIIPHPEIANRMFTLKPLSEIAPGFVHPKLRKTNEQMMEECTDHLNVSKV